MFVSICSEINSERAEKETGINGVINFTKEFVMESQGKSSKFGIISSILAILNGALWVVCIVIIFVITQQEVTSIDINNAVLMALLFYGSLAAMVMLTPLITITGMILSVLSLRKGEPKRFFAIASLVIHFLFLLPTCFSCITFFMPIES